MSPAPRRRARTVDVGETIPYTDPRTLRTPWWMRLRAVLGLASITVALGVALTVLVGLVLVFLFFVSDQILG